MLIWGHLPGEAAHMTTLSGALPEDHLLRFGHHCFLAGKTRAESRSVGPNKQYLEALSDNNFWMSWKEKTHTLRAKKSLADEKLSFHHVSTKIATLYCIFFVHHVWRICFLLKINSDKKPTKRTKKPKSCFILWGGVWVLVVASKSFWSSNGTNGFGRKKNVSDEKDPNVQKYLSECIRTEKRMGVFQVYLHGYLGLEWLLFMFVVSLITFGSTFQIRFMKSFLRLRNIEICFQTDMERV